MLFSHYKIQFLIGGGRGRRSPIPLAAAAAAAAVVARRALPGPPSGLHRPLDGPRAQEGAQGQLQRRIAQGSGRVLGRTRERRRGEDRVRRGGRGRGRRPSFFLRLRFFFPRRLCLCPRRGDAPGGRGDPAKRHVFVDPRGTRVEDDAAEPGAEEKVRILPPPPLLRLPGETGSGEEEARV